MFAKVLVANRGEIAWRILTTLRRMGLASVAVYSDADADTLPVRHADEAVRIGPAAPAASYLNAEAIIDAALAVGAGAIHPGYGFLAERAEFAEMVEAAGLVFIGPTPEQLRTFGAKHTARALAERAGVPLLPASGLITDGAEAIAAADAVGYPLMIKATAGGGGIGMRVCHHPEELAQLFETANRQAASAFGDGRVYLERYLSGARHIEVQVVGDGAGRVLTLGDRDCSTQRRHQKVLEESPAPASPRSCAPRWPRQPPGWRRWPPTVRREPSSSWSTWSPQRPPSSRSTPGSRSSTPSPRPSTASTWSSGWSAWPPATPRCSTSPTGRAGHAIEARVCAENPWRDHTPERGHLDLGQLPEGRQGRHLGRDRHRGEHLL